VTEPEIGRDADWQRLDPRMLLVHPIKELGRFLPVILGIFIAGSASGGDPPWSYVGIAIPVGLGLLRYLTTRFRISGGRVELRRGLLNTHVLSTRIDLVRTVDLTSSPIHRLLGLTTVRIGTGTASTSSDDRLDLDGLPTDRARELRKELLRRAVPVGEGAARAEPQVSDPEQVVARFEPGWLAYAPFTMSGMVIAAGLAGAGSQILNSLDWWNRVDSVPMVGSNLSWWVLAPLSVVVALALVSLLAIIGYAVTNWGFTLSYTKLDGSWHLRRGLLTTRETSIDSDRVRGVSLGSPLGLRLAGGRRLSAIVTGLDRRQQGSSSLVPPAPAAVVARAARDVLGTDEPLTTPLVGHGPRARTRRFIRALVPALALSGAVLVVVLGLGAPTWLLVVAVLAPLAALGLAVDRWLSLGHELTGDWLTVRSGSLNRRQAVLQTNGIIGWNLTATWFQRRAGLTTLVATTAGGRQAYAALDVPEDRAVDVTDRAIPGLVSQFLL
jgi:putative membrane protein